jgi:hypothetical protein
LYTLYVLRGWCIFLTYSSKNEGIVYVCFNHIGHLKRFKCLIEESDPDPKCLSACTGGWCNTRGRFICLEVKQIYKKVDCCQIKTTMHRIDTQEVWANGKLRYTNLMEEVSWPVK